MRKRLSDLRGRIGGMGGEEAKEALEELLGHLESSLNMELEGSVSMIKHPLSDKMDWYFTHGDAKTIPIEPPENMADRSEARLALLLERR